MPTEERKGGRAQGLTGERHRRHSWVGQIGHAFKELGLLSLTPILEVRKLLGPQLATLLQPKLQQGYSRIEWRCVSALYPKTEQADLSRAVETYMVIT